MMDARTLFSKLEQRAVGRSHFWGRPLVTIQKSDWIHYQDEFVESYDPFNDFKNYRTKHTFTHIHAIEKDGHIDFHHDFFNPDVNRLLAIPHFFLSVIPYLVWHLITWKKMYALHLK